jgi:hypothetical protein
LVRNNISMYWKWESLSLPEDIDFKFVDVSSNTIIIDSNSMISLMVGMERQSYSCQ